MNKDESSIGAVNLGNRRTLESLDIEFFLLEFEHKNERNKND